MKKIFLVVNILFATTAFAQNADLRNVRETIVDTNQTSITSLSTEQDRLQQISEFDDFSQKEELGNSLERLIQIITDLVNGLVQAQSSLSQVVIVQEEPVEPEKETVCSVPVSQEIPFFFLRQANAPQTENGTLRYIPATDFAYTATRERRDSVDRDVYGGYKTNAFIWTNRCNECEKNTKPNPPTINTESKDVRFVFTSRLRANVCTRAQLWNTLGVNRSGIGTYTNRWGVSSYFDRGQFIADIESETLTTETNSSWEVVTDVCPVLEEVERTIDGVVIDYEPQDGRSPQETLNLLNEFTNTIKNRGKEAILWTNPIGSGGANNSGLTSSFMSRIGEKFDKASILIQGGKSQDIVDQLEEQLGYYGDQQSKVYPIVSLKDLSLDEAKRVRAEVLERELPGLAVWRFNTPINETCDPAQQNIHCLAYGGEYCE